MKVDTTIPRVVFPYYGGKWNIVPWIIEHFPEHLHYVEPCGGAASVLLRKERAKPETLNDIHGAIVNFFRVLRDRPDELVRAIELTPWARDEFRLSHETADDPLEAARRFWVRIRMSIIGSDGSKSGMRFQYKSLSYSTPAQRDRSYLYLVADRLASVQIENRDALDLMRKVDISHTLIYFDPPYVKETRVSKRIYTVEQGNDFHAAAAEILRDYSGHVVISGYPSGLYKSLYEDHGWITADKEAKTNGGGKRTERLWIAPWTWEALQREREAERGGDQQSLFVGEAE